MTFIAINPGTGPVAGATEAHALANLRHFATDLELAGHKVARTAIDHHTEDDGRWRHTIWVDDLAIEIEMPGLPLHQVRWMDEPDQNIWDYPRLYVDGSSWIWKYALNICGAIADDDDA